MNGEWEVELVSALIEAIEREGSSEDVGGLSFPFPPPCTS